MNCILKSACRSWMLLCTVSFPKSRRNLFLLYTGVRSFYFFFYPSFLRGLDLNSVTERVQMKLPRFSYFHFKYAWRTFLVWLQLQILTPNWLSFFIFNPKPSVFPLGPRAETGFSLSLLYRLQRDSRVHRRGLQAAGSMVLCYWVKTQWAGQFHVHRDQPPLTTAWWQQN